MDGSRISENIMLLGLIVNTMPFSYENNTVKCDYNSYVEIDDVKALRKSLEDAMNAGINFSDELKQSYSDDIYFLDTMIQNLESK